jgi:4-hydroxy-L-threonine phosphate dehydrogenase PdxA
MYNGIINYRKEMDMSKEDKKVTTSVSLECWTELKVLAVRKRVSLQDVVKDILERSMQKKIKATDNITEE